MTYSFDSYGWLSAEEIAGRTTSVEPPAHGAKEVGQPYPNWTGFEWVLVDYSEPAIPTPVVVKPKLTRLEYLSRFTDAEAIAIDLGSIGATEHAATLRRMASLVANAEFVDLDDPRTIMGVQALEVMGYLSAGRAAEILA